MNEVLQLLPPLVEYSTSAPASKPATLSVPTFMMWSVLELPASVVSATVSAAGLVLSSVKVSDAAHPSLQISYQLGSALRTHTTLGRWPYHKYE